MGDTDKHEAIKDLRERMGRLEGAVSNISTQVQTAVAAASKEISGFIHEIDRRALADKAEESDWKVEHAQAVANCEHKGRVATEAKIIAEEALDLSRKAHRVAVGMVQPKGSKPINWFALIAALTALATSLAGYFATVKP